MNTKSIKSFAALLLLGTGLSASMNPAKADYFCYRWESNCKADGRMGTSGNDIAGLGGGDTVEKLGAIGMSAATGSAGGTVTLPIIGTVGGGIAGTIVGTVGTIGNGIYQTYKRERDASYAREDAAKLEAKKQAQDDYNRAYTQFEAELEAQGIR
jgi:hypothetical protein